MWTYIFEKHEVVIGTTVNLSGCKKPKKLVPKQNLAFRAIFGCEGGN